MKICNDVDLADVIMDVKFEFEKLRDFDVIGGQNSPPSHWLSTWALLCSATALSMIEAVCNLYNLAAIC